MKKLRMSNIVVTALIAFLPASAAWMAGIQDEEMGQKVYTKTCTKCHGDDGKGDTKAGKMLKVTDLTTKEWEHGTTQSDVEKVIREGVPKMPKNEGKLTEAEIASVAFYVRKLCGKTE